ncbi:I78 family peptidase inhibitor [Paracoccus alkenifer]|uniref:Peptidase inhibitor I78 family protein n=1 Tax=Paracoccus alkenifer TaxID=65735 RepID=A0A1H6MJB9_9RHOB|nr:I78 family peptidase inhibitor [Paracoccus alkenifer]SEH99293.1 Peptidase inhibitor I78 family protein [Paracoccus alkenifer]
MRLPVIIAAIGGTAALAACAPPPSTTTIIVPEGPETCIATDYAQYVGERSPAISLPAGTVYRHYRTGDPVTADFNPNRVNFEYNRSGTLVKVSCG